MIRSFSETRHKINIPLCSINSSEYTHCFSSYFGRVWSWEDSNRNASYLYTWWFWRAATKFDSFFSAHDIICEIISLNITTTPFPCSNRPSFISITRRGKLIWGWTISYILLFQIILGGVGCAIWSNLCAYFAFWL